MARADEAPEGRLRIAVAVSPETGVAIEVAISLPHGARVRDALSASGVLGRYPQLDSEEVAVGIWGRACTVDAPLADGDRVELYRPLAVDPKEARRRRARDAGKRRRGGATCSRPR